MNTLPSALRALAPIFSYIYLYIYIYIHTYYIYIFSLSLFFSSFFFSSLVFLSLPLSFASYFSLRSVQPPGEAYVLSWNYLRAFSVARVAKSAIFDLALFPLINYFLRISFNFSTVNLSLYCKLFYIVHFKYSSFFFFFFSSLFALITNYHTRSRIQFIGFFSSWNLLAKRNLQISSLYLSFSFFLTLSVLPTIYLYVFHFRRWFLLTFHVLISLLVLCRSLQCCPYQSLRLVMYL